MSVHPDRKRRDVFIKLRQFKPRCGHFFQKVSHPKLPRLLRQFGSLEDSNPWRVLCYRRVVICYHSATRTGQSYLPPCRRHPPLWFAAGLGCLNLDLLKFVSRRSPVPLPQTCLLTKLQTAPEALAPTRRNCSPCIVDRGSRAATKGHPRHRRSCYGWLT